MIKKFLQKSQTGASLIELIIYFALLGIVLIIAVDIMLRTGEFSLEASTKNDLQDDARYVINRLTYDIHRAENVVIPVNLGDSEPLLRLTINGNDYIYRQRSQTLDLQRQQVGVPDWIYLTSNLVTAPVDMTFTRVGNTGGNPTIKITFTLRSTTVPKGGPKQKTFETVVGTR